MTTEAFSLRDALPGPAPGAFGRALAPGPGIAFSAEGAPPDDVMAGMLPPEVTALDGGGRKAVYRHPQLPLELAVTHQPLSGTGALRVAAALKNVGSRPIAHVRDLQSLRLDFDWGVIGAPTVRGLNGGVNHYFFPPQAYAVSERTVLGYNPRGVSLDSGFHGRSSQGHIPLFLVSDEANQSGIFGGLEWSGDWQVRFSREGQTALMRGGSWGIDLTLREGEEIPFAPVLLGFYEGDRDQGANALRRCLLEHFVPSLGEERHLPPTYYQQFHYFTNLFDEDIMRAQVDVAAELGLEYFEIDAGWFVGIRDLDPSLPPGSPAEGGFSAGVGNWLEVDPAVFPSGLPAFADYVRSKGMHFGLWFEPERASLTSTLAREHPEWVLRIEPTEANQHLKAMATPEQRAPMATHGLVDFGNPEVIQWMQGMFTHMLETHDIRWIRWDFNMDPRLYWEIRDGPDRRGISQIRHIEGLYALLDWLRERYPLLFIDTCSSGGRRADLGCLRRAHSCFSSDHTQDTDISRNHLSGGSRFLPANWLEMNIRRPCREGNPWGAIPYDEADYPDSAFQARFGATFGLSDNLVQWSPGHRERARKHFAVYKQVRHLLWGDFYPLFPLPSSLDAWDGWQYHDPATGEGLLVVFRLRADDGARRVVLRGLGESQPYIFTDPYSAEQYAAHTGDELATQGLPIALPRNGSTLLTYRPA